VRKHLRPLPGWSAAFALAGLAALACEHSPGAPSSSGVPDRILPTVTAILSYPMNGDLLAGAAIAAGQSLGVHADAHDDRRVAWIGTETHLVSGNQAFDHADSVAIPDSATHVTLDLTFTAPAGLAGAMIMRVFVRDAGGNRVTTNATPNPVSIYEVVSPSAPSATLRDQGDVAYDGKRGVLYVTDPDDLAVRVLPVATLASVTTLRPPGRPRGVDLTASGDSLVVTLDSSRSLAVYDLSAASGSWTLLPLPADTIGLAPAHLAIGKSNRALVGMTTDDYRGTPQVLEHDFATGAERWRTDLPTTPRSPTWLAQVFRDFKGSVMVLVGDRTVMFDVASDAYLPYTSQGALLAADSAGDRFFLGGVSAIQLTDRGFDWFTPYAQSDVVALSSRGDSAFFRYWTASGQGLVREVRLADGVAQQALLFGSIPDRLLYVPGRHPRLLVFAFGSVYSVALDSLPPLPAPPASARELLAASLHVAGLHTVH